MLLGCLEIHFLLQRAHRGIRYARELWVPAQVVVPDALGVVRRKRVMPQVTEWVSLQVPGKLLAGKRELWVPAQVRVSPETPAAAVLVGLQQVQVLAGKRELWVPAQVRVSPETPAAAVLTPVVFEHYSGFLPQYKLS